jgi:hypothetical protein
MSRPGISITLKRKRPNECSKIIRRNVSGFISHKDLKAMSDNDYADSHEANESSPKQLSGALSYLEDTASKVNRLQMEGNILAEAGFVLSST